MPLPNTDRRHRRDSSSSLGTTMLPSDLDLVTYNRDDKIHDIRKDPAFTRIVPLLDKYQAAVDKNTSIFRHRDQDPQLLNAGAFEANPWRSCPLAEETEENGTTPRLNVMDMIREAVDGDLVSQEDGTYQLRYQGRLMRLSEYERRFIIDVRKVFQSRPDPDHMKKEDEAIEAAIEELRDYEMELMHGKLYLLLLSWT